MPAYKADPNDSTKQIPQALSDKVFGKATIPAIEIIQEVPSYVLINTGGTYAFAYNQTGSVGAAVAVSGFGGQYISGSVVSTSQQGPVRLDIQPTAWRQIDAPGSTGDVTFIYRGGK